MLTKIKHLLANIPRQQFLYYNKRQIINVVISCYEQVREIVDTIDLFITNVNKGIYNGKDGKPGPRGLKGDPFTYSDFTDEQINNIKAPALEAAYKANLAGDYAKQEAENCITATTLIKSDISKIKQDTAEAKENANVAKTTADEAKSIALGRAKGYVFDTVDDMNLWVSEHFEQLNIGDNLYIRDIDVPDYWWDGTTAQCLETQKVDLDEYTKITDFKTINGNSVIGAGDLKITNAIDVTRILGGDGLDIDLNDLAKSPLYTYAAGESELISVHFITNSRGCFLYYDRTDDYFPEDMYYSTITRMYVKIDYIDGLVNRILEEQYLVKIGISDFEMESLLDVSLNKISEEGINFIKSIAPTPKEWYGTLEEFNALSEYIEDMNYYITED